MIDFSKLNSDALKVIENVQVLDESKKYDDNIKSLDISDDDSFVVHYNKNVNGNPVDIHIKYNGSIFTVYVYFENFNMTATYDFNDWNAPDSNYKGKALKLFYVVINRLSRLIDDADFVSKVFDDAISDLESDDRK